MEKREEPRKRTSLSRRIQNLLLFSVIGAAMIVYSITYSFHVQSMISEYFSSSEKASHDAAKLISGKDASKLCEMIFSKEYRDIADQASDAQNPELIHSWMIEHGYEETYRRMEEAMDSLKNTLDVDDSFLFACDESGVYMLCQPGIAYDGIGLYLEEVRGIENYPNIRKAKPWIFYVFQTFYCRSYYPLENTDPYMVFIGTDITLTDSVSREIRFLFLIILISIVILVILSMISLEFSEKYLTVPLSKLTEASDRFAKQHEKSSISKPEDPDVHTNDELEDLNNSIYYLENSVLAQQKELEKINRNKGRLDAELTIAREIQKGVMPDHFPQDTDRSITDIYALNESAREVGGDFYDFFMIDDTHVAFVIGDVSDKGVPAALFMMVCKLLIEEYVQKGLEAHEVLMAANKRLCELNRAEMFVTVWIGILDTETGILETANGGHENPIFRLRNGKYKYFDDVHGLVLGALPETSYQKYEIQMKPGDALLVYSDGVTDAMDEKKERFEETRLLASVQNSGAKTAKQLVLAVRKDIAEYSGDAEQFDDITLLAMIYRNAFETEEEDEGKTAAEKEENSGV